MAEKEKDYSQRDFDSRTKSFRIDVNNPQEGQSGPEMFKITGETPDGKIFTQSLAVNGLLRITNEGTTEIVGGSKNEADGVDIRIYAAKGGIAINADKGNLQIKGRNIFFETPGTFNVLAQKIQLGNSMTRSINIEGFETQLKAQDGNVKTKDANGLLDFFKSLLGLDF
jgi:uncharacterized protein (DUF2345 family)